MTTAQEILDQLGIGTGPAELDHDTVCVAQAGQLLDMNCLEYETAGYGLSYKKDGVIYYYISSREDTIQSFIKNACHENILYTPVKYYRKRFDVVEMNEAEIREAYRYEIAQILHDSFPELFFEALEVLTASPSTNAAYPIVEAISKQLENCFDENYLCMFSNLIENLLQSRLLNKEAYHIFSNWLTKEHEKNTIEPIASSSYRRYYSGFSYLKPNGTIGYFADGVYHLTLEKRDSYISKGYTVSPIIGIQYYADNFQHLSETRQQFVGALKEYFDADFMEIIKQIKNLPPTVDADLYHQYLERIEQYGTETSLQAFRYYGYLWNVLK